VRESGTTTEILFFEREALGGGVVARPPDARDAPVELWVKKKTTIESHMMMIRANVSDATTISARPRGVAELVYRRAENNDDFSPSVSLSVTRRSARYTKGASGET